MAMIIIILKKPNDHKSKRMKKGYKTKVMVGNTVTMRRLWQQQPKGWKEGPKMKVMTWNTLTMRRLGWQWPKEWKEDPKTKAIV